jgi:hypothetical protein
MVGDRDIVEQEQWAACVYPACPSIMVLKVRPVGVWMIRAWGMNSVNVTSIRSKRV